MAWALGIWILLAAASLGVEKVVVGAAPDLSWRRMIESRRKCIEEQAKQAERDAR
jgi:hypothetical protein